MTGAEVLQVHIPLDTSALRPAGYLTDEDSLAYVIHISKKPHTAASTHSVASRTVKRKYQRQSPKAFPTPSMFAVHRQKCGVSLLSPSEFGCNTTMLKKQRRRSRSPSNSSSPSSPSPTRPFNDTQDMNDRNCHIHPCDAPLLGADNRPLSRLKVSCPGHLSEHRYNCTQPYRPPSHTPRLGLYCPPYSRVPKVYGRSASSSQLLPGRPNSSPCTCGHHLGRQSTIYSDTHSVSTSQGETVSCTPLLPRPPLASVWIIPLRFK